MATYIYANDDAFHQQLGKAISENLSIDQLAPIMLGAAEEYLIPWIGQALWNDLVDGVENNNLTAEETTLLPYVQRPLAWFTMFEYANVGEVMVSDQGFMRQETETQKTAYKNQVNNYTRYAREMGYHALEAMLNHMESATAGTYTAWEGTDENTRNREAFINTARDFRLVYSVKISRYVMETMRGLMLDIEEFAIVPILGTEFFNELKTAINDKNETADQKTIIKKIQKAVAAFTVEEAIRRTIVKNTGEAIVVVEALEAQSNYKEGVGSSDRLQLALKHNDEWGNRHISAIKDFLNDNRATYPTYETWIETIEAAAEEAESEEENNERYVDPCRVTSTRNKTSVVRL